MKNDQGTGIPNIVVMIFEKGAPLCACQNGKCVPIPHAQETTNKNGVAKFEKEKDVFKPNTDYLATINMMCMTPQPQCNNNQQCGSQIISTPFQTDKKGKFKGPNKERTLYSPICEIIEHHDGFSSVACCIDLMYKKVIYEKYNVKKPVFVKALPS